MLVSRNWIVILTYEYVYVKIINYRQFNTTCVQIYAKKCYHLRLPDQKFLAFLHLGDIKKFYIVH